MGKKRGIKEEIKRNGEARRRKERARILEYVKREKGRGGSLYAVPEASRSDMPRGRDRQGQPLPASYICSCYWQRVLSALFLRLFIYL